MLSFNITSLLRLFAKEETFVYMYMLLCSQKFDNSHTSSIYISNIDKNYYVRPGRKQMVRGNQHTLRKQSNCDVLHLRSIYEHIELYIYRFCHFSEGPTIFFTIKTNQNYPPVVLVAVNSCECFWQSQCTPLPRTNNSILQMTWLVLGDFIKFTIHTLNSQLSESLRVDR